MEQQPSSIDQKTVLRALSRQAYERGDVRFVDRCLKGFTHVVSTRGGLFVINEKEQKLICHGMFFGLITRPDEMLVFECCDLPRSRTRLGRLLRFKITNYEITDVKILADGLDNGCHQMEMIDGKLTLLDTYNQQVLVFSRGEAAPKIVRPIPHAQVNDWPGGYRHMNSILQIEDRILIMLHNGGVETGMNSEILYFDLNWKKKDKLVLPGLGCHDFGLLKNGDLLCCASMSGELISTGGARIKISQMMTRGLSIGDQHILVGSTALAKRDERQSAAGKVSVLSSMLNPVCEIELPAGPTEICRLDGAERTLSEHLRALLG